MENQKKWNIELLYSFIFLIASFTWITLNPFARMRDLTDSIYSVKSVMITGFYIFILLSLYLNIQSLRKAQGYEKKIFGLFPNNAFGGVALIVLLLSIIFVIFVTILIVKLQMGLL